MSVKGMLFIDANQYLDLYRMLSGKDLLPALEEQRDYIFVTAQVVDEVHREKVKVAASFLAQLKKKETKEEIRKLTHDLLEQVSQSRDEVSKALAGVFSQAVAPNEGELQRARARKERGNPPGKKTGPLGDQLSWEQILSQCQDKRRLWIITKDSDYATKHEGKMFLNAALYQELARLYQSPPEVFCFDNIAEGFKHFTDTTPVKAEKLPTSEETEQIKKEQESLPPLGWLTDYDDSALIALQGAYSLRDSTLLRTALSSQVASEEVFPPPEANEADKDGT